MRNQDLANSLLLAMREDQKFQIVMAELKEHRPSIPKFSPGTTTEANQVLLEKIKHATGQQSGFDLLYSILTGQSI